MILIRWHAKRTKLDLYISKYSWWGSIQAHTCKVEKKVNFYKKHILHSLYFPIYMMMMMMMIDCFFRLTWRVRRSLSNSVQHFHVSDVVNIERLFQAHNQPLRRNHATSTCVYLANKVVIRGQISLFVFMNTANDPWPTCLLSFTASIVFE